MTKSSTLEEQSPYQRGHDHDHESVNRFARGHAGPAGKRSLLLALLITLTMMVAEVIGGLLANSLALLSDAGHMFTDTLALALSYFAMRFAEMPATERKTFGFYRLEILAALVNGTILVIISLYIMYQAYLRLLHPQPVQGGLMLAVAVIGLIVNVIGALFLIKHHETNLNIRGAFLHIIGDAISSIGVIIGGIVIALTNWYLIDPILSILIALGIIAGAGGLVAESVNVLLESTPAHLNITHVAREIGSIEGVREAYHIHIWTITSGVYAMSAHVLIDDRLVSGSRELLDSIRMVLARKYGIQHSTIQLECERCDMNMLCSLPTDVRNEP